MAAILKSAILNLAILESAILVFLVKVTHTCQDWFQPFAQKNFTHSLWLKLMMAAILNSAMLDWETAILVSDTLLSFLRFIQIHFHSTLTLTQTNSIRLKLIHSHFTWWWQPTWILPSWIWPSWIQTPCYLLSDSLKNILTPLWLWLKLIQSDYLEDGSHLEFCHLDSANLHKKKTWLIHSDSTWWWQPSWILTSWIWPSWIQPS